MLQVIRIVTRESALALWQARYVGELLEAAHAGLKVEIIGITTQGDRDKRSPLSRIGGKGVFVKELETALLQGTADIAVHSMKDVPAVLPPGLEIAAICERDDPRDAFVSNEYGSIETMLSGKRVGTSSLRRRLQLAHEFPSLTYVELRGNVDTRLRKLDDGDYDAIILAVAGLRRLGREDRISQYLDTGLCLPAAGQGAVGIECSSDAADVKALLAAVNHERTSICVRAERLISAGLGASCNLPIAGFAELTGNTITIAGFVSDLTGSTCLRASATGKKVDADSLALDVTQQLISRGADRLIPPASL